MLCYNIIAKNGDKKENGSLLVCPYHFFPPEKAVSLTAFSLSESHMAAGGKTFPIDPPAILILPS